MTITFDSQFWQNEEKKQIHFSTELLTRDTYEGAQVFEFKEPEKNILTRIEISQQSVIIITGASTIEMQKGAKILNQHQSGQGLFEFYAALEKVEMSEKVFLFEYTLGAQDNEIGRFKITLEISP